MEIGRERMAAGMNCRYRGFSSARTLYPGINFMRVDVNRDARFKRDATRALLMMRRHKTPTDVVSCLLQDGAGGERGPAGRGPRGQQVPVRGPPGISRVRGSAALDASETRGPGGPLVRPAARNGRDFAARQ